MRCRELTFVALLASGCGDNLAWRELSVGGETGPTRFLSRSNGEVWLHGAGAIRRSRDGSWDALELCPTPGDEVSLSFDGDDVWALCGTFSSAQTLVRYDGDQHAEIISPPFDGRIVLFAMAEGVVVAGETQIFERAGDDWAPLGDAPEEPITLAAGRTSSDLYAFTQTVGTSGLSHWDGSSWQPIEVGPLGLATFDVRAGDVWLANVRLREGEARAFGNTGDRPVGAFTVVPPSTVMYGVVSAGGHFWFGEDGDEDLEFVGDGPLAASVNPTDTNAANNFVYAIDEHTLVLAIAGTTLVRTNYALYEGSL